MINQIKLIATDNADNTKVYTISVIILISVISGSEWLVTVYYIQHKSKARISYQRK